MDVLTFEEYKELLSGPRGRWYDGRWSYYGPVIDIIKELSFSSALELGPGKITMVKECDIMVKPEDDYWGIPNKDIAKSIFHDATEKPWPVKDGAYDLFIALQVWEHLNSRQTTAFKEVMRTSKMAILSFPYLWDCPKDNANYPEHHMITKELIGDWTLNVMPAKIAEIPRTAEKVSRGPRLSYFWNF